MKLKEYLLIILSIFGLSYFNIKILTEEFNSKSENLNTKNLIWEKIPSNEKKKIIWEKFKETSDKNNSYLNEKYYKSYEVKSFGRGVTFNNMLYPEISNYVPNGFVHDNSIKLTTSVRGISKTRYCSGNNFSENCIDGVLDLDLNLISTDKFSLNSKVNFQSLSDRGTNFGEGISLGFKIAKEYSENFSLSIGGENVIHFDDTIDLGRNFYLVASKYYVFPSKRTNDPKILFLNAGVGSDFYGYRGNGFLGRTYCFGDQNLTGNGGNTCSWGPIGSLTLAFNKRIALINEWFGYGYGSGISIRPFDSSTLNISIFATDFIKGFPVYANESCFENNCSTRYYGSISLSF